MLAELPIWPELGGRTIVGQVHRPGVWSPLAVAHPRGTIALGDSSYPHAEVLRRRYATCCPPDYVRRPVGVVVEFVSTLADPRFVDDWWPTAEPISSAMKTRVRYVRPRYRPQRLSIRTFLGIRDMPHCASVAWGRYSHFGSEDIGAAPAEVSTAL